MRDLEEHHEMEKTKLLKELDDLVLKHQDDIGNMNTDYQNKLKIAYA
jgi:hypothetical protein